MNGHARFYPTLSGTRSSRLWLEYLAEALELVASGAVKPMIEVFPKDGVRDAYERAASGAVRFKAVVTY